MRVLSAVNEFWQRKSNETMRKEHFFCKKLYSTISLNLHNYHEDLSINNANKIYFELRITPIVQRHLNPLFVPALVFFPLNDNCLKTMLGPLTHNGGERAAEYNIL